MPVPFMAGSHPHTNYHSLASCIYFGCIAAPIQGLGHWYEADGQHHKGSSRLKIFRPALLNTRGWGPNPWLQISTAAAAPAAWGCPQDLLRTPNSTRLWNNNTATARCVYTNKHMKRVWAHVATADVRCCEGTGAPRDANMVLAPAAVTSVWAVAKALHHFAPQI